MFVDVPGVRLMCGTTDRGIMEPAEPAQPNLS